MKLIAEKIIDFKKSLPLDVQLIAVSKTKPIALIEDALNSGHLDFGENKVQELIEKHEKMSKDIRWHMIGHLQRNKVKHIASFVHLIHGVDSERLMNEINKQGKKNNRKIPCLIQFHIAKESTKFGFSIEELKSIIYENKHLKWENIVFKGVMGMATFTDNKTQVEQEFKQLKSYFDEMKKLIHKPNEFNTISMGMSNDYDIAIKNGSNMIRVGSSLFGARH
ncbi:MAG: YggS family pyridoxal phosphate-dependent enzyme [Crocinitomicaceae bacterium]|nr:YggS family pyridoxal phosphate-dependent enzyme [Crocinitomicaceae bacterium]